MSWQKKEEHVRKVLSEKFGAKFEEREVPLRGTDKPYRFDLVSPDGSIVGEVKTYVSPTKSGQRPSAKIARASEGCLFLMHAEGAKKRLLILIIETLHFTRTKDKGGWLRQTASK
jgi:hypothetical protein